LASDHWAAIYTHMDIEFDRLISIKDGNRGHHFERDAQRAFGIILMRYRRAEEDHDFIAHKLIHGAFVFSYDRHQSLKTRVD
jgi:hypothetical protein